VTRVYYQILRSVVKMKARFFSPKNDNLQLLAINKNKE